MNADWKTASISKRYCAGPGGKMATTFGGRASSLINQRVRRAQRDIAFSLCPLHGFSKSRIIKVSNLSKIQRFIDGLANQHLIWKKVEVEVVLRIIYPEKSKYW
jgi:hypothetical protein